MKICLINNLYKPYQRGGAETVVESTYQALIKAGHDCFVITTTPDEQRFGPKIYYLQSKYYNLNKYNSFVRFWWHLNNLFSYNTPNKIKGIIKTEKPDLVITHNLMGLGFQTPRIIKDLGVKHFHILHDIQLVWPSGLMYYGQEKKINTIYAKVYQAITKKCFSYPEKIISPSAWLLRLHQGKNFFSTAKTQILPNPIELETITERKKQHEPFSLLFLGQIEKHKGIELLLSAFQKLEDTKFYLRVAGAGSLSEKLQKKYQATNLKFLGRVKKEELPALFAKSDLLILPSICYENFPVSLLLAASFNTPSLASDLGGASEIIKEYGGLLFSPQSEEDLIKKIKHSRDNWSQIKIRTDYIAALNPESYIKNLLK